MESFTLTHERRFDNLYGKSGCYVLVERRRDTNYRHKIASQMVNLGLKDESAEHFAERLLQDIELNNPSHVAAINAFLETISEMANGGYLTVLQEDHQAHFDFSDLVEH